MITFAGNIVDHLIAHLKTRCYRFRQPDHLKTRCYRFRQPETDLGTRLMELEADSNLHHA